MQAMLPSHQLSHPQGPDVEQHPDVVTDRNESHNAPVAEDEDMVRFRITILLVAARPRGSLFQQGLLLELISTYMSPKRVMRKVGLHGLASLSASEVSLWLGQFGDAAPFVAPFAKRQASWAREWV